MKTLKFHQSQIPNLLNKSQTSSWRLYDDKDLSVDDTIEFINANGGESFGYAKIIEVINKKICNLNDIDKKIHGEDQSPQQIIKMFRKYYGPNITDQDIVKIIKFEFLGEKPPKKVVNKSTLITEVKAYTDGGSRGNPGPSASGYVITDISGQVIAKGGGYLGITTNNQAEYQAVKMVLELAKKMQIKVVHIMMDSLLVANQMNGIYKIRNRELWPIHQSIVELKSNFEKVSFTHIPRELNKLADEQVNIILDKQDKTGIVSELL